MKLSHWIYIIIGIVVLGLIFIIFKPKSTPQTVSSNQPNTTQTPIPQITATQIIEMKPESFVPDKITIKKNTQVIFKNEDSVDRWPASNIHPTHLIYPEFDPKKPIPPGEQWSFIFDKVGIWKMHDHLVPSITGTIEVTN